MQPVGQSAVQSAFFSSQLPTKLGQLLESAASGPVRVRGELELPALVPGIARLAVNLPWRGILDCLELRSLHRVIFKLMPLVPLDILSFRNPKVTTAVVGFWVIYKFCTLLHLSYLRNVADACKDFCKVILLNS